METEKKPANGVPVKRLVIGWTAYAEQTPMQDMTIIAGSWRKYRGGWEWSMSSVMSPGEHGSIDDDRTHWLCIPAPPGSAQHESDNEKLSDEASPAKQQL